MPSYLVRVRSELVTDLVIEADDFVEALSRASEMRMNELPDEKQNQYWNGHETDDPLELCPHCIVAYEESLGLVCCREGMEGWKAWKAKQTKR